MSYGALEAAMEQMYDLGDVSVTVATDLGDGADVRPRRGGRCGWVITEPATPAS